MIEFIKKNILKIIGIVVGGIGTLHGVFGAEVDSINGKIEVSHTDEVTPSEIETKLRELGFEIITQTNENEYDAPSIWGCVL